MVMILTKNNIKFRSKIKVVGSIYEIRLFEDWVVGSKYIVSRPNVIYYLIQITGKLLYEYDVLERNRENIWI